MPKEKRSRGRPGPEAIGSDPFRVRDERLERGANHNEAQILKAQEHAIQALELRKTGMTWDAVAKQAGYSSGAAACKAVSRLIERLPIEGVGDLRRVQYERMHTLLRKVWPVVLKGPPGPDPTKAGEPYVDNPGFWQAFDRARSIIGDIRSLYGLDRTIAMPDGADADGDDQDIPVLGGSEENYRAVLQAIRAVRQAEEEGRMAAHELKHDDESIIDAEVVDGEPAHDREGSDQEDGQPALEAAP